MADFRGRELSFWKNGPAPGQFYNFPYGKSSTYTCGTQRTTHPTTAGTSVLAIRFDGGVMIAADTLLSYGSMAMIRNVDRLMKVNDTTVLGAGGDYADYQYLQHAIEERVLEEDCIDDGFHYTPKSLFSWLTRIMYYRRSKFDPLWNAIIVAGLHDGKPFIGQVDKIGCAYEAPAMATGYGAHIALPLMREAVEKNANMSEKEARELMDRCMKILYYRDARAFNNYKIAMVTKDGARVEGPFTSNADWSISHKIKNP